jgi:hypothetical protein
MGLHTVLETADPAADTRRQRVLSMLAANPDITHAIISHTEIERDAVIVTLDIRDKATCELRIPIAKYDGSALQQVIEEYTGPTANITRGIKAATMISGYFLESTQVRVAAAQFASNFFLRILCTLTLAAVSRLLCIDLLVNLALVHMKRPYCNTADCHYVSRRTVWHWIEAGMPHVKEDTPHYHVLTN